MKRIKPGQLTAAVQEELEMQSREVIDEINDEVKRIAQSGAEKLKATSPKSSGTGGRKGHYADGWKVKEDGKDWRGLKSQTIFNSKKPQISHLLEHGHAKAGGVGRVPGIEHIAPVEDDLAKEIERLGK